ncbi:membrane protein DedA with SNARE-associated domain [Bradyrhizobium sp. LM2.7]
MPVTINLASYRRWWSRRRLARISHTALAKWPGFAVLVVDFCAGARPRGSVCRGILGHFHDSEGLFLWALDHAA